MSLSWFTTVPGLLITGGVLLLVIALIIFVVTSVKDKNKSNNNGRSSVNNNVTPTPSVQEPVVGAPQPVDVAMPQTANYSVPEVSSMEDMAHSADLNSVPPTVENVNNDNFSNVGMTEVANESVYTGVDNNTNMVTEAVVNTEMPVYEQPVVDVPTTPSFQEPVVDNVAEPVYTAPVVDTPAVQTYEQPVVDVPAAPSYQEPVADVQPEIPVVDTPVVPVEETKVEEQPSIYGGATPTVPSFEQPVVEPQIYGGANPLENTQSVPIADITNTAVQEPVVEQPVVSEPVVDTNVNIPAFDTPVVNEPVENNVEVANTNAFEQPTENYQNVEIPTIQVPTDNNM